MKRVLIFQENVSAIEVTDPDETDLEEYSKKLHTVLESGNVSILSTPLSSLIVRPSKIISILVQEVAPPEPDGVPQMESIQEKPQRPSIEVRGDGETERKEKEEDMDIVTDID